MATAFETFVQTELPQRPVMLTLGNTSYDGNPNAGGAPAKVSGAPKGSFYLQDTGYVLWKKNSASAGTWEQVGAGTLYVAKAGDTMTGNLVMDTNTGVQVKGGASRPAAGVSYEGLIWMTPGGTGVADSIDICLKDDDGTYLWVPLLPLAGGLHNLIF